ncbi:MAG: anhydro-N-acetylmuramic acid kinase [Robiginitomaculum sp.]|nr:MAG: anhydro-N-acetylmuramic acid kinase [Robiginitomaculum sp.]
MAEFGDKIRYNVIGLMSGTSLDGVDAAILDTDGEVVFGFGATHFRSYTQDERQILSEATQAALAWRFKGVAPNIFARAERIIHTAHIEAVQAILQKADVRVDLIGFHGQTVLHQPPQDGKNGATLQLGNGQVLADALGIDVVYDFRTHDVAQGGQGAPLAPLYHNALLQNEDMLRPVAVLNIGGVSNITLVDNDGIVYASDCGPGNGPLDSWIEQKGLGDYDKDGVLSLAGTPDVGRVQKWLRADFFAKPVPKSADRWDFNVLDDMQGLSPEDGAATLVAYAAESIRHTLAQYGKTIATVIVCGGGRKNPAMLAALAEQSIGDILTTENVNWRGDDLEAEAFAYLAVRSVRAMPLSTPETTGVRKPVTGGQFAKAP